MEKLSPRGGQGLAQVCRAGRGSDLKIPDPQASGLRVALMPQHENSLNLAGGFVF